jgi:cysteine-rich repeat protein
MEMGMPYDIRNRCTDLCKLEKGYLCTGTTCTKYCPNGVVDTVGTYVEVCDDGNLTDADGKK